MSVLNAISQFLTPSMIGRIANMLGIPQGAAQTALKAAVPMVLSTLLGATKTTQGTDAFSAALARQAPNPLDALTDALGNDASSVADMGGSMLSSIIGGGPMNMLASKLKDYAGLPETASSPLLGVVGSLAMAGLGKSAQDGGLDTAGVLRQLQGEKDAISRAIPSDFAAALGDTGLLDAIGGDAREAAATAPPRIAAAPRPAATPVAPPEPERTSGGWSRWIIGLAVLALLAWLLSNMFGRTPETPTTAAPATAEAPATAAMTDPLMVGDVDLGATVRGAFDQLTTSLGGISDAATAEAALPDLTAVRDRLAGLDTAVAGLSTDGKSALQTLITGALPTLRDTIDRLLGNAAVAGVIKPVLDDILAQLTSFTGS